MLFKIATFNVNSTIPHSCTPWGSGLSVQTKSAGTSREMKTRSTYSVETIR